MEKWKSDDLNGIADKLREVFPPGMNKFKQSYKGGTCTIARRLCTLYNTLGKLDEELAVEAAKRYVNSYHGNYTKMRILYFFILDDNGSQLLDWMENPEEEEQSQFTWEDML